jgi:tRNA threonylcarbamoyladenosine biosynthesis protein TsaE
MSVGISTLETIELTTRGPEETRAVAARLTAACPGRLCFALRGELGSGKTCFVQGVARAAGVRQAVTSPTFTLVSEYRSPRPLAHVDLYRVRSADEALAFGIEDLLERDGILAVEWPERIEDLLPPWTVGVRFAVAGEGVRRLAVQLGPAVPAEAARAALAAAAAAP